MEDSNFQYDGKIAGFEIEQLRGGSEGLVRNHKKMTCIDYLMYLMFKYIKRRFLSSEKSFD